MCGRSSSAEERWLSSLPNADNIPDQLPFTDYRNSFTELSQRAVVSAALYYGETVRCNFCFLGSCPLFLHQFSLLLVLLFAFNLLQNSYILYIHPPHSFCVQVPKLGWVWVPAPCLPAQPGGPIQSWQPAQAAWTIPFPQGQERRGKISSSKSELCQ